MKAQIVLTDGAPAPIGPYSQAIRLGEMIFTAGQIALAPDGVLIEGDAAQQTRQVIANLDAVLTAAGGSLASVVKTTIFLLDMDDFALVNEVYAEFFGETRPARSTVQVARLPKDALVEIEAVAYIE